MPYFAVNAALAISLGNFTLIKYILSYLYLCNFSLTIFSVLSNSSSYEQLFIINTSNSSGEIV
jgi:hypothetical protein